MKHRSIAIFSLALCALLLSGCAFSMRNLTPAQVPANPSRIYTLSVMAKPLGANINKQTIKTEVIVDGNAFLMEQSPDDPNIYNFDYPLPVGRAAARFYYMVSYKLHSASETDDFRQRTSNVYQFNLTNRYVVELEAYRGPIGAVIPVLGRGFTRGDSIIVGPTEASTEYVSENLLRFSVPNLNPGQTYPVVWRSGFGDREVGTFRIDGSARATGDVVAVTPTNLAVTSGETVLVGFQSIEVAPPGGIPVEVTTDIPESVIMPAVVIPEGFRTVSVRLQGGLPDSGSLFVNMPGAQGEIVVPITVRPRQ